MLGSVGSSLTGIHSGTLLNRERVSPRSDSTSPAIASPPVAPSTTPSNALASVQRAELIPLRNQDPVIAPAASGVGQQPGKPAAPTERENTTTVASDQHQAQAKDAAAGPALLAPEEKRQVDQLRAIDRDVRNHEAAHAAAGGGLAGAPSYDYTRGPDGKLYATAGEVGIDTSRVSGDPAATIEKARTVIQAALAPANPSAQDLRVAAQAQALLVEAQAELSTSVKESLQGRESEQTESGTGEDERSEESRLSAQDQDERRQELQRQAEERLERSREQQVAFAEQLQDLNQRLNDVHQGLIRSGAVDQISPQGSFLDLIV